MGVKSGGEKPRGLGGIEWVKGRCPLKLMVKRSMETDVVAAAAAVSSWLLHEWNGMEWKGRVEESGGLERRG